MQSPKQVPFASDNEGHIAMEFMKSDYSLWLMKLGVKLDDDMIQV